MHDLLIVCICTDCRCLTQTCPTMPCFPLVSMHTWATCYSANPCNWLDPTSNGEVPTTYCCVCMCPRPRAHPYLVSCTMPGHTYQLLLPRTIMVLPPPPSIKFIVPNPKTHAHATRDNKSKHQQTYLPAYSHASKVIYIAKISKYGGHSTTCVHYSLPCT